jgi:hypothetical protein
MEAYCFIKKEITNPDTYKWETKESQRLGVKA